MCFSYAGHLLKCPFYLGAKILKIIRLCKRTCIYFRKWQGVPAYRHTAIPFHIFVHHNLPYDIIYYYIYYNIYNNI